MCQLAQIVYNLLLNVTKYKYFHLYMKKLCICSSVFAWLHSIYLGNILHQFRSCCFCHLYQQQKNIHCLMPLRFREKKRLRKKERSKKRVKANLCYTGLKACCCSHVVEMSNQTVDFNKFMNEWREIVGIIIIALGHTSKCAKG